MGNLATRLLELILVDLSIQEVSCMEKRTRCARLYFVVPQSPTTPPTHGVTGKRSQNFPVRSAVVAMWKYPVLIIDTVRHWSKSRQCDPLHRGLPVSVWPT